LVQLYFVIVFPCFCMPRIARSLSTFSVCDFPHFVGCFYSIFPCRYLDWMYLFLSLLLAGEHWLFLVHLCRSAFFFFYSSLVSQSWRLDMSFWWILFSGNLFSLCRRSWQVHRFLWFFNVGRIPSMDRGKATMQVNQRRVLQILLHL
jgi:hypothetical protein